MSKTPKEWKDPKWLAQLQKDADPWIKQGAAVGFPLLVSFICKPCGGTLNTEEIADRKSLAEFIRALIADDRELEFTFEKA